MVIKEKKLEEYLKLSSGKEVFLLEQINCFKNLKAAKKPFLKTFLDLIKFDIMDMFLKQSLHFKVKKFNLNLMET